LIFGIIKFILLRKNLFIFLVLFCISLETYSQEIVSQYPVFKSGAKITYNAVYNWGFIWLKAGIVEFSVNETSYFNEPSYHLIAAGVTLPSYDWLFKVRDYYQSYTQRENLSPLFFSRNTYEGGYQVNNRFEFNYTDSTIYTKTKNTNKPYSEDTLTIKKKTYDVLSAVYLIRNIDFTQYSINDTIPVSVIIDNEIFDLYIRYLGKEIIKTHDKRKFNTLKFSALLVEGTIFKGGEDLFVWVTDDLNRIPILVEAKILIGSIKATLKKTENLKFPLSSEITIK
jgi:Protein of unknown function (DUF3108)